MLKTSSKTKIQLALRKFEKEVIAQAKFYKISSDPIETEVLEDEWPNFKFEVLRNCRYADDNWRTVLTIAAEQELDFSTIARDSPLFPRLPEQYFVSMLKTQL